MKVKASEQSCFQETTVYTLLPVASAPFLIPVTVSPVFRIAKLKVPPECQPGRIRAVSAILNTPLHLLLCFLSPLSPALRPVAPPHCDPTIMPQEVAVSPAVGCARRRLYGSVRITPPSRTQRPRTVLSGHRRLVSYRRTKGLKDERGITIH